MRYRYPLIWLRLRFYGVQNQVPQSRRRGRRRQAFGQKNQNIQGILDYGRTGLAPFYVVGHDQFLFGLQRIQRKGLQLIEGVLQARAIG